MDSKEKKCGFHLGMSAFSYRRLGSVSVEQQYLPVTSTHSYIYLEIMVASSNQFLQGSLITVMAIPSKVVRITYHKLVKWWDFGCWVSYDLVTLPSSIPRTWTPSTNKFPRPVTVNLEAKINFASNWDRYVEIRKTMHASSLCRLRIQVWNPLPNGPDKRMRWLQLG